MEERRAIRRISGVVLVVIVCTAFVSMGAWWSPKFLKKLTSPPLAAGAAAPQFELESLNGEIVSIGQFEGKPVLLKFWSVT